MNEEKSNTYKTELEGIKAPLGVLLHLIKRDNIDIYDIPIAKITKDYLEYLDAMEKCRIDLAGEFFVMAATLMRIKVQMLLRRDDDAEDPREELVRNLVEYKRIVEAAHSFKEMEDERLKVFRRPVPQNEKELRVESSLDLNLFGIMRAFREIMAEFDRQDVSHIIPEEFTVEEKIDVILETFSRQRQVAFRELFAGSASRLEVVVTFIALLELLKRTEITCKQEGAFGVIWIYRAESPKLTDDAHDQLEQSDT